jgi:hypothetical protein
MNILGAWRVADVVEDDPFRLAIAAEHLSDIQSGINEGFQRSTIEYAFGTDGSIAMLAFILDTFLLDGMHDMEEWMAVTSLPTVFYAKLCAAAPGLAKGKRTCRDALREHISGQYELKDEAGKSQILKFWVFSYNSASTSPN